MLAAGRWPAEGRAVVRTSRAFVGRVRVTRIPVAVVVHGRLGVHRAGAVGGLQHFPGLGVQRPETVRPGELRSERRFPPSARAVAGRSVVLIRTGPDCSWPRPNGDAALTAIHRHLEPANRSSYTGSLPCLSYSRSMISSIIATSETLCYLLEQFARQPTAIRRDTLLPGWPRHDAFRALRQAAPRALAEGDDFITLSDTCSRGQKTGSSGCAREAVRGGAPSGRRGGGRKRAFRPLTARSVGVR